MKNASYDLFNGIYKNGTAHLNIILAHFVKKSNEYLHDNLENFNIKCLMQEELSNNLLLLNLGFSYILPFSEDETFIKFFVLANENYQNDLELQHLYLSCRDSCFLFKYFIYGITEIIITSYSSRTHNIESYLLLLEALNSLLILLSGQLYQREFLALKVSSKLLPNNLLKRQSLSIVYDTIFYDQKFREEYASPLVKALLWFTIDTNLKNVIRDRNAHLKEFLKQQKLLQNGSENGGSFVIHYGSKIAGGLYNGLVNRIPTWRNSKGDTNATRKSYYSTPDSHSVNGYNVNNSSVSYPPEVSMMMGTNFDPDKHVAPYYTFCNMESREIFGEEIVENKIETKKSSKITNESISPPLLIDLIAKRSQLLLSLLITSSVPPPPPAKTVTPMTEHQNASTSTTFLTTNDPRGMNGCCQLSDSQTSHQKCGMPQPDLSAVTTNDNSICPPPVSRENHFLRAFRTFNNDTGEIGKFDNISHLYGGTLQGVKQSPMSENNKTKDDFLIPNIPSTSSSQSIPFTFNFNNLYQYFCTNLEGQATTLLFYLLFHHNSHFRAYVLARSDIESLIMPLLKNAYEATSSDGKKETANSSNKDGYYPPCHQLYLCLIICLMFTEDDLFNTSIHKIILKCPQWFIPEHSKNTPLHQITLGSFTILVLLKVIQSNLARIKDKYLHTNCLAAISNMSSKLCDLHPYVSQRLINLYVLLMKHYLKLIRKLDEMHNVDSDKDIHANQLEMQRVLIEAQTLREMLAMLVESLYNTLSAPNSLLQTNCHLVYTMLYNERYLNPNCLTLNPHLKTLEGTPFYPSHLLTFIQNLHNILNGITLRLNSTSSSIVNDMNGTSAVDSESINPPFHLTVEEAMEHLKQILQVLPDRSNKMLANLKFKYVEEEWPEIFFIPYTWSLVCLHSHLYFDMTRVKVFNPHEYYSNTSHHI